MRRVLRAGKRRTRTVHTSFTHIHDNPPSLIETSIYKFKRCGGLRIRVDRLGSLTLGTGVHTPSQSMLLLAVPFTIVEEPRFSLELSLY